MSESNTGKTVVLDLGKQKRKKVKDLRKGKGALMEDVNTAISELQAEGTLAADAQVVVVIVERKPETASSMMNPMSMMRR